MNIHYSIFILVLFSSCTNISISEYIKKDDVCLAMKNKVLEEISKDNKITIDNKVLLVKYRSHLPLETADKIVDLNTGEEVTNIYQEETRRTVGQKPYCLYQFFVSKTLFEKDGITYISTGGTTDVFVDYDTGKIMTIYQGK